MSQALPSCEGGVHISQPANTVQAKEGPAARRTLLTVPVGHPVATHTALRSCVLFQGRPCGASPAASGETRPSSALCSACPTSMPMGPRTCWSSSRRRTRYCPIPAVRPPHRASSGLPRLAGRALPTRAARAALGTAQAPCVPQPCQPRPRRPAGGRSEPRLLHLCRTGQRLHLLGGHRAAGQPPGQSGCGRNQRLHPPRHQGGGSLRPRPLRYVASAAPGLPPPRACWHPGGGGCGAGCASRDARVSPAERGPGFSVFPGTALCSRSVKGLYEKVSGRDSSLKSDPLWEDMLSATSHRLLVHRWGE